MLFCWFNFLDMKAVKNYMEKRQGKKIGGQDSFYILTLFLGFTTIQWARKLFLNPNEMAAPPRQGSKLC